MLIPQFSLLFQHARLEKELKEAFEKVLLDGYFSGGPTVSRFENKFADYCNRDHCTFLANGSEALQVALKYYNFANGAEVLIPAHSFIASAIACIECGLTPVLADIDLSTFSIDFNRLKESITENTVAFMGVSMFGIPYDYDCAAQFCNVHNLIWIDDCSQAHGAAYDGRVIGSMADVSCFSFYPTKNLGALGEAGALLSNNAKMQVFAKKQINYGGLEKYHYDILGDNRRGDTLQAAFLSVKLKYLEEFNESRRSIASRYLSEIDRNKYQMVVVSEKSTAVWHQFPVIVKNGKVNDVMALLTENRIGFNRHYAVPMHKQEGLKTYVKSFATLENTEYFSANSISLPIFPELTDTDISEIVSVLNSL